MHSERGKKAEAQTAAEGKARRNDKKIENRKKHKESDGSVSANKIVLLTLKRGV